MSRGRATIQTWICLCVVALVACIHFGWEGLAAPVALWLLMPQIRVTE